MKLALFYEIPVARPWSRHSEHEAYKNVVEQAVLGEQAGFHSLWTVEHHFLEEFSHCSNPEILYGHIAAKTSKLRLGYGVRLLPRPYNHPVRTAESVAVLDLLSDGRVEFGTGRSATRDELEGFGIDPNETRGMWEEALDVIVGAWTTDVFCTSSSDATSMTLRPPCVRPRPTDWRKSLGPLGLAKRSRFRVSPSGLPFLTEIVGISFQSTKLQIETLPRDGLACAGATCRIGFSDGDA